MVRNQWLPAILLVATTIAWAAPQCYFIKRAWCGTGGGFCQTNQVVCDVGYETVDTGCGVVDSSWTIVDRKCYRIVGSTLTVPCNVEAPQGYVPVGCRDGGVCCYTTNLNQTTGGDGSMLVPGGSTCGCDTQGSE